ncbi:uncharacterized protein LOC141884290 isoform X4 [Acropora palmata]|uniref:uncharacterized protein LOC141884290 isoform X4 n=1 Tax=Acropora palmata TaxID=6131 RepID=UPI003DA139C9
MLLASKSCFVLLLAFYVTTPYSLYVAEEEDDANEDGTESDNEVDDESLMATLQSANASEESDDANEDGAESENEVNDESLIATVQSANALEEADTKRLMSPEIRPKSFRTLEKRAPGLKQCTTQLLTTTLPLFGFKMTQMILNRWLQVTKKVMPKERELPKILLEYP